jgi:hypothetical protein
MIRVLRAYAQFRAKWQGQFVIRRTLAAKGIRGQSRNSFGGIGAWAVAGGGTLSALARIGAQASGVTASVRTPGRMPGP